MEQAIETSGELRRIDELTPRVERTLLIAGAAGLLVSVLLGVVSGWAVFFRSYLLNYTYVLSLGLGALFFVLLQHLVRAGWSVGVRRLAECVVSTIPLLVLLFVPLLVPVIAGMRELYPWSSAEAVAQDELLQMKQPYLNVPFFIARCVFYFAVWALLARYFVGKSIAQDASGDVNLTLRMQWWSAPAMLLFALTLTFFSIDALMSLNPAWFSTIWGVYFFSGSAVGFFALLAVMLYAVQRAGRLTRSITIEHYHDVGKLAFGFVVFWAYIAFSQYMLIWYANIPEETVWYQPRQGDTWWISVSLLLLFGHFMAPFLALISRFPKRRKGVLVIAAIWLLAMHWLDLYYIVKPHAHGAAEHGAPLHLADVTLLVGLGCLWAYAVVRAMARHPLLPERDPRLHEALTYENV